MSRFLLATFGVAALVFTLPLGAQAQRAVPRAMPCNRESLVSMADRSHTKMSPFVTKRGQLVVETTYYQNASKVGGSALAAFPEARIRYGLLPRVELFVDTPSEIAKSGNHGNGIYYMTQTGYGAKVALATLRAVDFSLTAQSHPPLGALANLNLEPLSDVHLSANWSASAGREFGAELGVLNQHTVHHRGHLRASALLALSATQALNERNSLTFELMNQTNVYSRSRSQTSSVVALNRMLSSRMLFNFEVGTTFNEVARSKPHYMGFGFTYR